MDGEYIYTCIYIRRIGLSVYMQLPTRYINLKLTMDLSMFMAINFCVFCQKHELLDIKKKGVMFLLNREIHQNW